MALWPQMVSPDSYMGALGGPACTRQNDGYGASWLRKLRAAEEMCCGYWSLAERERRGAASSLGWFAVGTLFGSSLVVLAALIESWVRMWKCTRGTSASRTLC